MLKSMTGYGTDTISNDILELNVEVKSLNSKFLDTSVRLSRAISDKEIEVRNMVTDQLVRGKVSVSIEVKKQQDEVAVGYDQLLFNTHYEKLKKLAEGVGANTHDIFRLAVQSPDVISNQSESISIAEYWETMIKQGIFSAIEKCNQYRADEGQVLQEKLVGYIGEIRNQLTQVIAIDAERVERVKTRISNNLETFIGEEKIDQNRFEQELIYYIEKLDISEEKVRLTNHLDYFTEVINLPESNGKKLGFIAQEIGREVNTIGSKANDANMQKMVVVMKEELEKIKEQVLNVL